MFVNIICKPLGSFSLQEWSWGIYYVRDRLEEHGLHLKTGTHLTCMQLTYFTWHRVSPSWASPLPSKTKSPVLLPACVTCHQLVIVQVNTCAADSIWSQSSGRPHAQGDAWVPTPPAVHWVSPSVGWILKGKVGNSSGDLSVLIAWLLFLAESHTLQNDIWIHEVGFYFKGIIQIH